MTFEVLTAKELDHKHAAIIAVTGGIGSGKSTVAAELAKLGAVVVSADVLAREVVEPGTTGLREIREAFGSEVINKEGSLDRAALAKLVFSDPKKLATLEAITHPLIATAKDGVFQNLLPGQIGVYDIPLLSKPNAKREFDLVVVVEAPKDLKLERLELRGLARDDAERRMATQASDAERREFADIIIRNDSDVEAVRAATRDFARSHLGL